VIGTVRVKNPSKTARSIRPYQERGVLVTLEPEGLADIELRKCGYDVKANPRKYFTGLGLIFDPAPIAVIEPPEEKEPEPKTPPIVKAQKTKDEEPKDAVIEPINAPAPGGADKIKTKISIEKGNIKHFHTGNKLWHTIKLIKEWVVGKVIYNETDKAYFKVTSLDGDLLVAVPMTEEEALKATGVKP
jgi:hypothetical protein